VRNKEQEQHKQFMFHFIGRDSIDARNMNEEELKFIKNEMQAQTNVLEKGIKQFRFNYKAVQKLVSLWMPEYLI